MIQASQNNKILNHVERIKLFNFYLQNNTIQYDVNIELESSNKLVIKKLAIQNYYGWSLAKTFGPWWYTSLKNDSVPWVGNCLLAAFTRWCTLRIFVYVVGARRKQLWMCSWALSEDSITRHNWHLYFNLKNYEYITEYNSENPCLKYKQVI